VSRCNSNVHQRLLPLTDCAAPPHQSAITALVLLRLKDGVSAPPDKAMTDPQPASEAAAGKKRKRTKQKVRIASSEGGASGGASKKGKGDGGGSADGGAEEGWEAKTVYGVEWPCRKGEEGVECLCSISDVSYPEYYGVHPTACTLRRRTDPNSKACCSTEKRLRAAENKAGKMATSAAAEEGEDEEEDEEATCCDPTEAQWAGEGYLLHRKCRVRKIVRAEVRWKGDTKWYPVTLSVRAGEGGGHYIYATSVAKGERPTFEGSKLVPPCAKIEVEESEDVPLA